eukprot:403355392
MDDWLRKVQHQEITVADLKAYKSIKGFTRSYLRDLKNPVNKSSTGDTQTPLKDISQLPTFEVDNTQNIMILVGSDQDTKIIVESFLQANVKTRTKYKCCVLHHCIRENKMTHDSYYIFIKEMIQSFDQERLDLQKDYPEVLIKFLKVLKELKLDYNIGIFITGIENLFQQNRLDSFIYLLRSASIYFPNFVKLILTIEKRPKREETFNKIIKILDTQTMIKISDQEVFQNEGKSYMDFALNFASGQNAQNNNQGLQKNTSQDELKKQSMKLANGDTVDEEVKTQIDQVATTKSNLELSLQKCQGSYRKGIEIINGLYKNGINQRNQNLVQEFIQNHSFEEDSYKEGLGKVFEQNKELTIKLINSLAALHGPIHIETFMKILLFSSDYDQQQDQEIRSILKELAKADTLLLINSQILKINPFASAQDLLENNKTILCLKRKHLFKSICIQNFQHKFETAVFNDHLYKYHLNTFESGEIENEFEDLDSYFRIYIYKHLAKNQGSYGRFRNKLAELVDSDYIDREEKQQLIQFSNILFLIEQTIRNEPLNFLDFCTQLRGRILGETLSEFLTDLRLDITSENICYFKNFHHALRENPRIDQIIKLPKCTVLRIKFFMDKKRVIMSLSNGLMLIYNIIDYTVVKVFVNKFSIIDSIKIIDDKYIITAGIDPKIKIWNLETEKTISEFDAHQYSTLIMSFHKEFIFSYGYDMRLMKYNFKDKKLECQQLMESSVTAMKLLKTLEESYRHKLAVGFLNGQILLYDLNLLPLKNIQVKSVNEEIIQLINISNTEFLCFTKEGSISILNNSTLEESKQGSIFNIKSEDYIDLILIKSKEYFLFTLERQKIEFYSASTFKRTDSWDYFFERDLICCDKNKEGSKIFVSDKAGYTILFNFLKNLDQTKENLVPCNRRYDPVVCIEVTERLETNSIISCSQDRDLRIWRRDNGVFIKKYDLSSFTGENITAMKLGKDENMLFLGSKDMNVYLIDIAKGKLCVVYEGHWNRVTSIYTIPNKDILITISESNIKVWDLEYDECIKNMNEHNSSIVYINQSQQDEEQVMTIGQSFEFKIWNYVTGNISQAHEIELNKDKKQLKNLNVVCCDVHQDMAYIALNTNEINVYSIKDNKVLYSFISYNDEQIIFLNGIKTEHATYLIVVTRTACVLYLVQKEQVKRLCSYLVNARKKPKKKKHDNKYSYNVRYYFTSAKITPLSSTNIQPNQPGPTGKRLLSKNLNQTSSYNNNAYLQEDNSNLLNQNNIDNSGEPTHIGNSNLNGSSTQQQQLQFLPVQQHGSNMNLNVSGAREGNYSNTKIVDTMGTKIKDTVVLVCLGDSRGFVHMNHLILK